MSKTTALLVNNSESVNTLVNRDLRSNVSKMLKATAGMNKDLWVYAIVVHNIVENDLYKDDFKTLQAFAEAMDTSKGTLTKYDKAVEIALELEKFGYDMRSISVSNAYLLSTLGDELEAFIGEYHNVDLGKIAKSQLEAIIKKFKGGDDEEEEIIEETEEKDQKKAKTVQATIEDGQLTIIYRKVTYRIALQDLKDYIVKE